LKTKGKFTHSTKQLLDAIKAGRGAKYVRADGDRLYKQVDDDECITMFLEGDSRNCSSQ